MKNIFIISLIALFCACASNPAPRSNNGHSTSEYQLDMAIRETHSTNEDQLDMAIRETSDYFNKNLKAGNKLAILNIQSNSLALSNYINDELVSNIINDQIFTIVERQ